MANEAELPLSPALRLAQQWAHRMEKETRTGELVGEGGARTPLLLVAHGSRDLMVRTQGDCVVVFLLVDVSEDAKARFGRLIPSEQRRALRGLRRQLLDQPRSSFAIAPREAKSIVDVNRVAVEQLIRISDDDPSSFNRFADAMQEVVNAAVRAFLALSTMIENTASNATPPPETGPPAGMYL